MPAFLTGKAATQTDTSASQMWITQSAVKDLNIRNSSVYPPNFWYSRYASIVNIGAMRLCNCYGAFKGEKSIAEFMYI